MISQTTSKQIAVLLGAVFFFIGLFLATPAYAMKTTSWSQTFDTRVVRDDMGGDTPHIALYDPSVTITYGAEITNASTGAVISDGASVAVGTTLNLTFKPHASTDVYWFGTGGAFDTPYGEWRSSASSPSSVTCASKDYFDTVYSSVYRSDWDLYAALVVNPPTLTLSNTTGLSCGAINGSGVASCTVTGTGAIAPVFNYSSTYFKMYGRLKEVGGWGGGSCHGSNSAMFVSYDTDDDPNGPTFQPTVSAKTISFSITGYNPNAAPTAPTIGGPTSGYSDTNHTFTFTSTDSNGDTLRYGLDWNNDSTVDEWLPSSGYVSSGTQRSVTHSWPSSGVKTFKALAQDSVGTSSAWTTYSITISALAGSCSPSPSSTYTTRSVTWTASMTGGSGSYTYSWSGSDSLSGSNSTVSKTYSSAGTKTASVYVVSGSQSATISCSPSATITTIPAPTLSCVPTAISPGGSANLNWTCPSSGCTATFSLSSSPTSVSPTQSTTYTISNGVTQAQCGIDVPPPDLSISADISRVRSGAGTIINWTASNVDSCEVERPNGANWSSTYTAATRTATGSKTTGAIISESVYTLVCQTASGEQSASVTVQALPTIKEF